MKKIISLFQRNYGGDGKVRDEVVPGAEWRRSRHTKVRRNLLLDS